MAFEQRPLFPTGMIPERDDDSSSSGFPPVDVPSFSVISEVAEAERVLPVLRSSKVLACDTETTGLDPRNDRIRLVQLALPHHVYVFDIARIPIDLLQPVFNTNKLWIFHNAKFDLKFLTSAGCEWPVRIFDTMLASQVLNAGHRVRHSLKEVVKRELRRSLPKDLQKADWSAELSPAQFVYAARDAVVLHSLHDVLSAAISDAGLERASEIEFRCARALAWMELTGIGMDAEAWCRRADNEAAQLNDLTGELDARARQLGLNVNWASSVQVRRIFDQIHVPVPDVRASTLRQIDHPIASLLVRQKELAKRVSTYGRGMVDTFFDSGSCRVYPEYFQNGAATGRMSCGRPNIQQIPKAPGFRTCFRAADGMALVKADYSQIELRIAAALAEDATMLRAFQEETDLHALTASSILGRPIEEIGQTERQLAKSVNFGLLYGMGVKGLQLDAGTSYGITMSVGEAAAYHRAFFETYTGVAAWHRKARKQTELARRRQVGFDTRTLTGRRFMDVSQFNAMLNIPVQGSGGDGLKLALARLFETRESGSGARPVACVHDEILVETPVAELEASRRWVVREMVDAMGEVVANRVPIVVETEVGKDWGGTPLDR